MIYKNFIRPLLFRLNPELVHNYTLNLLSLPGIQTVMKSVCSDCESTRPKKLFGLTFKNPIGLAAGFDKDGAHIDALGALGFGFVEIGTVTPLAQPGNSRPRLFRLPADRAILNRMGFNNGGAMAVAENLKQRKSGVIVGGNIGKNKITPNGNAADDYRKGFIQLAPYVDYFVINVSSPNTPNLRALQDTSFLAGIIDALQNENNQLEKPKPLLVKISPDLPDKKILEIVDLAKNRSLDGLVATNTTLSRTGLRTSETRVRELGNGGISGAPLNERSTQVIRLIKNNSALPVIGVGGIMSPGDALEKIKAGADLIQIYTSLIYNGPFFVKRLNRYLNARV